MASSSDVTLSGLHSTVTSQPGARGMRSSTDTRSAAGTIDGVPPPTKIDVAAGIPAATWVSASARQASAPQTPARVDLSGLSKTGAIVWGRGGPTVTVFSDFHCGYCRALAEGLRTMNVTVVERPISVLGSRDIANQVLCARNREAAVRAAYAREPIASDGRCDTRGLDENERFAREHGFTGTPVIVRADGAVLEGYRPPAALAAWLKGSRS